MTVPYSCIKTLGEAYDYLVAGQKAAASVCPGPAELAYASGVAIVAAPLTVIRRGSTRGVDELKYYITQANNLCAAAVGKKIPLSYPPCTAATKAAGTTPVKDIRTAKTASIPWWLVGVFGGGVLLYLITK